MKKIDKNSFPSFDSLPDKEHQVWKEGDKTTLLPTPIFDIVKTEFSDSNNKKRGYIQVKAPNWVCVIPVFKDSDGVERFVMERQFRFGSKSLTLEYPGGLVNVGEEPLEAAKRELLEETGIRAHSVKLIGKVNPNSSFMTNSVSIFLAEDLEETGEFHWDEDENIDICTIPVEDVIKSMGTGMMDNGTMLLASFLFLKDRGFKI